MTVNFNIFSILYMRFDSITWPVARPMRWILTTTKCKVVSFVVENYVKLRFDIWVIFEWHWELMENCAMLSLRFIYICIRQRKKAERHWSSRLNDVLVIPFQFDIRCTQYQLLRANKFEYVQVWKKNRPLLFDRWTIGSDAGCWRALLVDTPFSSFTWMSRYAFDALCTLLNKYTNTRRCCFHFSI